MSVDPVDEPDESVMVVTDESGKLHPHIQRSLLNIGPSKRVGLLSVKRKEAINLAFGLPEAMLLFQAESSAPIPCCKMRAKRTQIGVRRTT